MERLTASGAQNVNLGEAEIDLTLTAPVTDPVLHGILLPEAAHFYRMLEEPARWIVRRTVHIEFDSAISMRRVVTCEVQLSEDDLSKLPHFGDKIPLPVAQV